MANLKILSLNINGLKAFYNRGEGSGSLLDKLIAENNPDIILFQETKCTEDDVHYWLSEWENEWKVFANSSEKKGYAGVACMIKNNLISKCLVKQVNLMEGEYYSGRILEIAYGCLKIVNVYTLNSGSEKANLRVNWDKEFINYIQGLRDYRKVIVMGDLNSVTDEKDCYAYEAYFDIMPGVCEFEIEALKSLKKTANLFDSFRELNPETVEYSWFSYRGSSRWNNQGFRLDYALLDESLRSNLKSSEILGSPCEYSDHSPILLTLNSI